MTTCSCENCLGFSQRNFGGYLKAWRFRSKQTKKKASFKVPRIDSEWLGISSMNIFTSGNTDEILNIIKSILEDLVFAFYFTLRSCDSSQLFGLRRFNFVDISFKYTKNLYTVSRIELRDLRIDFWDLLPIPRNLLV